MVRQSADERRLQLVAGATRVLVAEGMRGVTTRRIVREAGVSLATLHYCYRSLDELLVAVLEDIVDKLQHGLRVRLQHLDSAQPPAAQCVMACWEMVEETLHLQTLQFELTLHALRTEGSDWLADWQYGQYERVIAEELHAAVQRSDAPPPADIPALARFIIGTIDGLILQHLIHRDTARSRQDVALASEAAAHLASATAAHGV